MNVADTYAIPYRSGECAVGGRVLADRIGRAYAALDPQSVVAIGGSVARGDADRYSDLELFAYWSAPPVAQARRDLVESLEGTLWSVDRDGESMEHFGIEALPVGNALADGTSMVSVTHSTFGAVEETLFRVFENLSTDDEDHAALAIVRDATPVTDSVVHRSWQSRIADYSDALAGAMLRRHLGFGPWFVPRALILRGDRYLLHSHMLAIEGHLWRSLAALNRTFLAFPTGKWIRRTHAALPLTPDSLLSRLERCYSPDLEAGWSEMHRLMMETIDLVESRFGASLTVDSGEPLAEWARRRWNPLPPYTLMLEASRILAGGSSPTGG